VSLPRGSVRSAFPGTPAGYDQSIAAGTVKKDKLVCDYNDHDALVTLRPAAGAHFDKGDKVKVTVFYFDNDGFRYGDAETVAVLQDDFVPAPDTREDPIGDLAGGGTRGEHGGHAERRRVPIATASRPASSAVSCSAEPSTGCGLISTNVWWPRASGVRTACWKSTGSRMLRYQ
jgi:hypothetical protein